jgi:hypothetical protein
MGKIEDALVHPFKEGAPHLVKEDGQENGNGETEHQGVDVQEQGIFEDLEKIRSSEKAAELLEADPFAPPYTQADLKILEGDNRAVHGDVFENDIKSQREDQKNVKPAVPPHIPRQNGEIVFLFYHWDTLPAQRVQRDGKRNRKQIRLYGDGEWLKK